MLKKMDKTKIEIYRDELKLGADSKSRISFYIERKILDFLENEEIPNCNSRNEKINRLLSIGIRVHKSMNKNKSKNQAAKEITELQT